MTADLIARSVFRVMDTDKDWRVAREELATSL